MTTGNKGFKDLVNYDEKIEGKSFTIGWLLESLRTNDEEFIRLHGNRGVKNVSCKNVSAGKGFISVVIRCTLTFVDSQDENDTYSTILKIPGFDALEGGDDDGVFDFESRIALTKTHQLECDFYTNLSKIVDAPIPKAFKTIDWIYQKQEGCVHMEDLTRRGKTLSFFDNVNLAQVKCVIRHLAHMHKTTLTADPSLWKGKYFCNNEITFEGAFAAMDAGTKALVLEGPLKDQFEPLINKYQKFFLNINFKMFANHDSYKLLGLDPVIVHGDFHSGNLLWAIDSQGDIQNDLAALVDWQNLYEGSPMADLARFLTHCADGVVRRQAETFAVEYYLDCLTEEYGSSPDKAPYSLEKLKKAYDYAFLAQTILAFGVFSMFLNAIKPVDGRDMDVWEAYKDYGTLKVLHLYQDLDRLLSGDLKDVFEKFGH